MRGVTPPVRYLGVSKLNTKVCYFELEIITVYKSLKIINCNIQNGRHHGNKDFNVPPLPPRHLNYAKPKVSKGVRKIG